MNEENKGGTLMGHFTINLTEIEGDGEFSCPRCKEIISPDDDSGKVYDVLKTEENEGLLKKVTIKCGTCGSIIQLEGFDLLEDLDHSEKLSDPDDYLPEQIKPC
jgi:transcription elongation factor Elf1